ncbi:MAG: hypothetical protein DMG54_29935 [Acidobacteria bacterium]|nr:MAG: hypothetical protein DMG54_29935 [Acidobacteriota bacterium]
MSEVAAKKRSLSDTLLLWGTALVVAFLGVGYFLLSDSLHISKKLLLYAALNGAFCLLVVWRFRAWFRDRGLRVLLPLWLVGHLLVYGFLAYVNVNFFFYIFSFPAEVAVMRWIELRRAAIRREKELERINHRAGLEN